MTTEKLVQKYKEIYKSKTGQEISDEDALDQAIKLVTLVKAIHSVPHLKPQKD